MIDPLVPLSATDPMQDELQRETTTVERISHAGTVLCALEDLADGQGLPFELGAEPDVLKIVVVRAGDLVRAYLNRCPHFGIPLEIGRGVKTFRQHVLCVNHYAVFRFEDGYCIDGPCKGGALKPVAVEVRDGSIMLCDETL